MDLKSIPNWLHKKNSSKTLSGLDFKCNGITIYEAEMMPLMLRIGKKNSNS